MSPRRTPSGSFSGRLYVVDFSSLPGRPGSSSERTRPKIDTITSDGTGTHQAHERNGKKQRRTSSVREINRVFMNLSRIHARN